MEEIEGGRKGTDHGQEAGESPEGRIEIDDPNLPASWLRDWRGHHAQSPSRSSLSVASQARRSRSLLLLCLLLASPATAQPAEPRIFPYQTTVETLDNGLTIILVPMSSGGLLTYWTIVRTGARDEVEPGRTGFAHFFEHMMFRGRRCVAPGSQPPAANPAAAREAAAVRKPATKNRGASEAIAAQACCPPTPSPPTTACRTD